MELQRGGNFHCCAMPINQQSRKRNTKRKDRSITQSFHRDPRTHRANGLNQAFFDQVQIKH